MTSTAAIAWVRVCRFDDIPPLGARIVPAPAGDIAIFRGGDDRVFAQRNRCPHKQGPLSEGIVHGCQVTCPLHNWVIDLESGQALGADSGSVPVIPLKIEDGFIHIRPIGEASPPV